jgi:hypothetical protein
VLGGAVEDFRLGTNSLDLATSLNIIVAARVVMILAGATTSVCHF